MKKLSVTICIAIAGLGLTALYYFGHHLPAQRLMNEPPKKVYKAVPVSGRTTSDSQAHPPAQIEGATDNSGTPLEIQTATPLTTEPNSDTETPPSVQSQPAQQTQYPAHEPHDPSPEEMAADRAERAARRAKMAAERQANLAFLEEAERENLRMASEMAAFFNTLSVEEQRDYFKMFEKMVYEDIPRLFPGEDTPEDLDNLWNTVLSDLILVGYTPPEGVTLK